MTAQLKSNNRNSVLLNIIVAILYVLEYRYAYLHFVIERFGYANLTYDPVNGVTLLMLLQAVLPIVLYKGFRNIASGLSIFTYIFVYIPFVVTIYIASFPAFLRISFSVVFLILMCLFFATDNHSAFKSVFIKRKKVFSFHYFEVLFVLLFIIALIINRRNLTFVNFLSADNALYELRAEEGVGELGKFNIYLTLWLSHAFLPILLVYYYIDRKWLKFAFSIVGFMVMFMIDKQKITFIIPFVMWGMLYVYRTRKQFLERFFHIIIMSIMALSSLFLTYRIQKTDNIALSGVAMIVILRTQCIEGEQLDRYAQFFEIENNPYTYYGHVRFINAITHTYPYPKSIGEMVADKEGSNSNATFLLMDGLAAAGLFGCLFIGLIFIFVKSILNAMGKRYDNMLLVTILLFAIFSMLNTSLFTSLLSFGFIIIYLSLLFFRFPAIERQ